jgi:hypothetical protein
LEKFRKILGADFPQSLKNLNFGHFFVGNPDFFSKNPAMLYILIFFSQNIPENFLGKNLGAVSEIIHCGQTNRITQFYRSLRFTTGDQLLELLELPLKHIFRKMCIFFASSTSIDEFWCILHLFFNQGPKQKYR